MVTLLTTKQVAAYIGVNEKSFIHWLRKKRCHMADGWQGYDVSRSGKMIFSGQ